MSHVVLRTLGAAEATAVSPTGERLGRFGAGKPLALLVYLCRSPNQSAPRDHLVELLWGDVDPDSARHALRQTIWYVRKTLGTSVLRAEGDVVHLATECTADAQAFLQAVDQHDEEMALTLYHGDFLRDVAIPGGAEFERWADLERMRLRSVFTRTAESRVMHLLGRGEARAALPVARRARDADPGDERLWRRVLEVLIAAHDTLGAMAESDAFEQLWRADEREPEASTRALLRRARNDDAKSSTPASEQPPTIVAALVGRSTEFAALTGAWDDVLRDGSMRHVHISAPAGLGKTRLLTDFRSRMRGARTRVVMVRAHPGERAIPFSLLAEIVRQLAELPGAAAIAPDTASVLVRLNPTLSSLFPSADATGEAQEPLRRRTVALRELAAAVTDERTAVLLVDDVHWADRESLSVLAACADNMGGARLLFVTSARGSASQWFPDDLREIVLLPLDPRAVTEFVASMGELPDEAWADRLPLLLTGASAGSPLLVLETLQLAMEQELLRLSNGRWYAPDPQALERLLIGRDPLASRVGRLDDDSVRLLALLSAAGVPCAAAMLGLAAGKSTEAAERTLQALELRGLVANADSGWMPAHDEIAASALAALGPEATHRARVAVARAFASDSGANLGTLRVAAELLVTTGEIDQLAELFARFTRARERAGIHESANAHLQALVGEMLPPGKKRRVLRAAPWRTRLTRTHAVVAAAAVLLAATGGVWWSTAQSASVAVHLDGVETDAAAIEPMTLDLSPNIDVGAATFELSRHARRFALPAHGRARALVPSPDGSGWYATETFQDDGSDDPVFVSRRGTVRRLFRSPGDDNAVAVSPDGGRLAISTTRFSSEMHMSSAIVDLHTHTVTRAFASDSKNAPTAWSPDGTHLLVGRLGEPRASICIVGADGRLDRCIEEFSAIGWTSNSQILGILRSNDGRLARIDATTGDEHELCDHVRLASLSPDNEWLIALGERPGIDGAVFWLARAEEPCRGPLLVYHGTPIRAASLTWDVLRPIRHWLTRLTIKAPDTLSSVAPVMLWSSGTAVDGTPIAPTNVEWTSLDTSVAVVTPDGLFVPRSNGVARVVASAGGLLTDTSRIVVARREARLVARTIFDSSTALDRWYVFGWPRPALVRAQGRSVLSINGDSSYPSGIRWRQPMRVNDGLALRLRARLRLTANQWQAISLNVQTAAGDSAWLRWNRETGAPPHPSVTSLSCSFNYPAAEGSANRNTLFGGNAVEPHWVPAPQALREGEWVWLEVQVLPDGRCGGAVGNVPQFLTSARQPTGRAVELVVLGNAFHTQALIDSVEVHQGVLHPAWWSALDAQRLLAEPAPAGAADSDGASGARGARSEHGANAAVAAPRTADKRQVPPR